jgi:hypothetical protein
MLELQAWVLVKQLLRDIVGPDGERDPAGYREVALKQLWGEAYNGSDG